MAFDQSTRNRLQRLVSDARALLTQEFTRQVQHQYGMDPATGEVADVDKLSHMDDTHRETARLLRDTLNHYRATSQSGGNKETLERIVREQAFTVLNRLAALRMMETRGLLIESVARGYQSKGFQLYQRLAGSALGETGDAYRCYVFSLFDQFAMDLAVLFDRFSPQGRLFPREAALLALLNLINHPEIEPLWAEDETIGWIYQYYNSQEERRQMRADSPAPRNSRELAVRNQFFTPRYVVEFLADNTLGRLWYEMTQGQTGLTDQCRYLVRRPSEIFLQSGEEAPVQEEPQDKRSQEELLQQPVYIPFRALKDPRDITMLDPACGSMHFGLYAFDLFEVIYDEAWEIAHGSDAKQKSSASFASFVTFVVQYPDKAAFLADIPRLIIEHNLHGIDIDPRATQIAGLSLWLRAQRTWQQQGLHPQDRPRIRRSNIVCAEPMPGEEAFLEEFIEAHLATTPERKLLGQLVRHVFDAMKLAGEAGSLLKIEEEIAGAVAEAKQKWLAGPTPEQGRLFADDTTPPSQKERGLDVTGITDETFWEKAEERIYAALQRYAEQVEHGSGYQRRLFADEAASGFAFIDLCRKRYDVVLMNPPFGSATHETRVWFRANYPTAGENLSVGTIQQSLKRLTPAGFVALIGDLPWLQQAEYTKFREELLAGRHLKLFGELGWGILGTDVEVGVAIFTLPKNPTTAFANLVGTESQADDLLGVFSDPKRTITRSLGDFAVIENSPFAYQISDILLDAFKNRLLLSKTLFVGAGGVAASEADRVFRCWWEVDSRSIGQERKWAFCQNGSPYCPLYYPTYFVICADAGTFATVKSYPNARTPNSDKYWKAGLAYGKRTWEMYTYPLPAGQVITWEGQALFPLSMHSAWHSLALTNSSLYSRLTNLVAGQHKYAGYLNTICFDVSRLSDLSSAALAGYEGVRIIDGLNELSHNFSPGALSTGFAEHILERIVNDAEQSAAHQLAVIDDAVYVASGEQCSGVRRPPSGDSYFSAIIESEASSITYTEFLISLCLGCAFGRWDIRLAMGEKPAPELADPFAPLPVCPPGQLQNEQGLPITKEDVTQLIEEGRWNYPLDIPWDGILVDDPGHPLDFETRVHQVLQVIWKDRWEAIEREACEILGVRTLCDYFYKPAGFFADHLKRYSKSRRKAPIYWPLQTPSGSYTLWLYYHRLNDQTLYTCVNDFVEKSKLREVTEQLHVLRTKTGRSRQEEKDLERLLDLEQELKDFRDELLRLAQFWKPNLNDGVQITAAPLWKLFQHKPWQKTLKDTWEKLEQGDYDWAHLAYSIWPGRVRDACKRDKSLAIAHGLEELYEVPPEQPKKKRGRTRE